MGNTKVCTFTINIYARPVRWLLMIIAAFALSTLVWFTFVTTDYVADLRVRTEAMDAGYGYYDIFGDGQWHWGPHPGDKKP